jgi:hypothetical protein
MKTRIHSTIGLSMKTVIALLFVIPLNSLAGTFVDGNMLNQRGQGWQRAVDNRASSTDYVDAGRYHGYVTVSPRELM